MATNASSNVKTVWIERGLHEKVSKLAKLTGRPIKSTLEIALRHGLKKIEEEIDNGNMLTNVEETHDQPFEQEPEQAEGELAQ